MFIVQVEYYNYSNTSEDNRNVPIIAIIRRLNILKKLKDSQLILQTTGMKALGLKAEECFINKTSQQYKLLRAEKYQMGKSK